MIGRRDSTLAVTYIFPRLVFKILIKHRRLGLSGSSCVDNVSLVLSEKPTGSKKKSRRRGNKSENRNFSEND